MKWLLLVIFFLPAVIYSQSSKKYSITVDVKDGVKPAKVFLRYFTDNGPHIDSVFFTGESFIISGIVPTKLTVAKIFILPMNEQELSDKKYFEVWLEPGHSKIKTDAAFNSVSYSGSENQKQFEELQRSLAVIKEKNNQLDAAYEKAVVEKNELKRSQLTDEEYPALFNEKQKILAGFLKKYPSSLLSAYMFDEFAGYGLINLAIVEPVYEGLEKSLRERPEVEKVAKRIVISKKTSPGMDAINFSQTDTSGRQITLEDFKGKYVLLDFWAGWCMPCRAENPHLLKLYGKYKSKGFEILGISLDGSRKSWTKAIIADNLTWQQVSDLQVFDNAIAKLYGINSIPQNILIGKDGKIIAWNLRGASLDKKLKEIFN